MTRQELEVPQEMAPERKREWLDHLVKGCEQCIAATRSLVRPVKSADGYDGPIDRAIGFVLRNHRVLSESTDPLLRAGALLAEREGILAHLKPLQGLPLCETLLRWSWALRHDDPQRMLNLAQAAAEVAGGLDPRLYGAAAVADAKAKAWGELGNAYRVSDDLVEAERVFGQAFRFLEQGTGDPRLKARLHDLRASLYGTQRQFGLGLKALDLVHTLYLKLGDSHLAGRALITKGAYTFYSGRAEDAVKVNGEGLALIDKARDPGLTASAVHNQLLYLVTCGRWREARKILFQNRSRISKGGRMNELKVRWLDGRISYGLGDSSGAESAFLEVKQGFEATGNGFAAALASLDLAVAWLRQGRTAEAQQVVTEAAAVFYSLNIHQEVYSTVLLLKEAFRLEKATVELAEEVVEFIYRWEINPEARFDWGDEG